jgi:hypothetical protein
VLIDGRTGRLKLRDALGVDVGADNIVANFGETRSRHQANVTTIQDNRYT